MKGILRENISYMEVPRYWRLKGQTLRMEGLRSEKGEPVFPPKPLSDSGSKTSLHPDYNESRITIETEVILEEALNSN